MLQDRFALGQKYYAANDHENAVQVFTQIEKTPNFALLNVDSIVVMIGELTLPIRAAATYQLGNSYRNVGRALLERSRNAAEEGDSLVAAQRLAEARSSFNAGKDFYRRLAEGQERAPENMRVMALYQIARASYQMGDYAAVVRETGEMLRRFPGGEYGEEALYDAGWAHYYMGEYQEAIASFGRLLAISKDALKTDRALFQTGESHFALGQYGQARSDYGKLVGKYDFSALSDKELQEMKAQRLRGLVQETTRELVAKAQIRIGDAFAAEKRIAEAIASYSLVPRRYPQEELLVQKSFDNMATMVLEQQGVAAGIAVLRRAIEQVADPYFRGRVQLKIAKTLYAEGDYRGAIDEYTVYQKAYGDLAAAIGVTLDQVDFLIAEAYRELAGQQEAERNFRSAREYYQKVLGHHPGSALVQDAYYGLGQTHFGLGEFAEAAQAFALIVAQYPRAPLAPHALNWQARAVFAMGTRQEAVALYQRLIDDYPESPLTDQAWKDQGLVYKDLGQPAQAIDAFSRVHREAASWSKVQAEAGDLLLAAGRLEEIDSRFDVAGAIDTAAVQGDFETLAELYYIKGRMAQARGDYRAEVDHLTRALGHSRNGQLRAFAFFFRGLAQYHLGTAADATGDSLGAGAYLQASVADLENLLAAEPAPGLRAVAYRTRGVALTRLGRSDEAVHTYELLIEAAAAPEERSEFELMLMELYYDQSQLDQTEKAARGLIAARFAAADTARRTTVERAYVVLTSLLFEQERYGEVIEVAHQALERFPQSADRPSLMSVSARSLFSLERYEEAIEAFERFIGAYPEHAAAPSAYYQLGYCREILGQYEQAAEAFGALATRYPEDPLAPDALYRCGENLYNATRFQEAQEAYRRVSDKYPQSPFAEKALYSASWAYMDLNQEQESIATMERLVAAYPGGDYSRYAQFSIGDYYYSRQEFERAQRAYRQVVDRYPGTPEAQKAEGLLADLEEDLASKAYDEVLAEFDRGNYEGAARGFERVYEQYPRSYSALAALANKGVALEHLGNRSEARGTYEKVLEVATGIPEGTGVDIVEFVKLRLKSF
ncbi:MAG: tetratricopeptide repeat protein [Candidatus Latescibacteria bacterium]|nr:tetratricopeptide repeat protein [Candidatus Latescibacterota bacterium]